MTLEELEVEGQERTQALLGAWTDKPTGEVKKMLDIYKTSYDDITSNLEASYLKLSGIDSSDAGYYNELIKYQRLENLQKQVAKTYTAAAKKAGLTQYAMSETAMTNTYYQNMYSVNWFTEQFYTPIDEKAVEVAVYGTDDVWASINKANQPEYSPYLPQYGTLAEKLNSNAVKDLEKVKNAIVSGLRQGASYASVSKSLQDIFNTTASNAMRIARTEGHRAMSAGAYAQTQAAVDAGVDIKVMYSAVRDSRTRQQSGSMDGQTVDPGEPFVYPNGATAVIIGNSGVPKYDINDRCYPVDLVDGVPPEYVRGRNPATGQNEVTSYKSYDDWLKDNNMMFNKSGKMVPIKTPKTSVKKAVPKKAAVGNIVVPEIDFGYPKGKYNKLAAGIRDEAKIIVDKYPKPNSIMTDRRPRYAPGTKNLATSMNSKTFNHEYGHHLDYNVLPSGGGITQNLSLTKGFREAYDLDKKVYDYQRTADLTKIIKEAGYNVKTKEGAGISDIMDSFKNGMLYDKGFMTGHGKRYYSRINSKQKETFANLYQMWSTVDEWGKAKELFPNLTNEFESMMKGL